MIEYLVNYIQSIISQYGAGGVFFATLIEEVIAPIPSPIVPLAAGFFLLPASGSTSEVMLQGIFSIALPVALGISIGSALAYALGFFGGKPLIERTKRWTGINWRDIQRSEERLTRGKGDEITLFILRVLPIVPGVAISGFCGIVRYPFKKFMILTCLGACLRAFALGIAGWQAGELYANYADMVSRFEKYIFVGIIFLLILLFGGIYLTKRTKMRQTQPPA